MNTPSAEQVFKEIIQHYEPYQGCSKSDVLTAMEEYGRQMWNAAIYKSADTALYNGGTYASEVHDLILKEKKY